MTRRLRTGVRSWFYRGRRRRRAGYGGLVLQLTGAIVVSRPRHTR